MIQSGTICWKSWLVYVAFAPYYPVESFFFRDWRQQKAKYPIFKQRLLVGFRGLFKVPIERVALTEYSDVNFIEFPDL